ncbi:hypothetical protein ACQCSU_08110 [Pseudarthrobacter sp. O4]|uniref:hypothetical protein n=1 Tax=Pseudarthrobacter sp. O4 TaxID=3418417 RepID=UPI003CFA7538
MTQETAQMIHGKLAVASRKDRKTSPQRLAELKRDHTAAKIAEYVEREVRNAPPLTPEQLARISRAMRGTSAA